MLGRAGFSDAEILQRFDCFRGTSKERIAHKLGVQGLGFSAHK